MNSASQAARRWLEPPHPLYLLFRNDMNLIFERGDRDAPVGHALIYFHGDSGAIFATYVSVPPIAFDLTSYVPPAMKNMLQGMFDEPPGDAVIAAPIPPIPEQVESVEYLQALAARRQDDLVYAGATSPMHMIQDAQDAAGAYGELYGSSGLPQAGAPAEAFQVQTNPFVDMTERDQLDHLTNLTGRLRDSLQAGSPDPEIERQMRQLADVLPTKYRAQALVEAALTPGERGQKLAALLLERSYKLYNEEYLDLERLDREIEAVGD